MDLASCFVLLILKFGISEAIISARNSRKPNLLCALLQLRHNALGILVKEVWKQEVNLFLWEACSALEAGDVMKICWQILTFHLLFCHLAYWSHHARSSVAPAGRKTWRLYCSYPFTPPAILIWGLGLSISYLAIFFLSCSWSHNIASPLPNQLQNPYSQT